VQAFVEACRLAPAFGRMQRTLAAIVQRPGLHARFLNSLSRLEYVGVRKMLKARRAEDIDLDGLQHMLEEAVHATRLKKFARSVAPRGVCVETFAPEHTLEGEAAENYFQAVDRAAAGAIFESDSEACYALTSAAIEIRARCLYPAYQEQLSAAGSTVSVASITNDEEEHLREMERLLPERLPEWREQLALVMRAEAVAFERLLDAFEAAIAREC
jgi:hypothetical protein